MKKIKIIEYLSILAMGAVVSTLFYGFALGYALPTGTNTTVTTTGYCTTPGILTPAETTIKGPLNVSACQPGATGAVYYLVRLYTNSTAVVKTSQSASVDALGKISFEAMDTTQVVDGPYQINIKVYPAGNTLVRNIWVSNGNTTTSTTDSTSTGTVTPSTNTTGGVTAVPPPVTTDVNNLTNTGTSTTALQDYVNKQIAAEEEKKLPQELKAAPVSIVLTTEKAEVNMTNEKKGKVVLSGKAEPNTTIYLYIFSEPIVVSVDTDSAGNWSYTLDQELDAGKHDVYVAVKNDDGTIKAKSLPYSFFVGQATAAAGGTTTQTAAKPNYLIYYIIFVVSVVSLVVSGIFYFVARKHVRRHEELA